MQLTNLKRTIGGVALAGTIALTGIIGLAQQGVKQGPGGGEPNHGDRQWKHEGDEGMRGGREGFGGPFGHLNLTDAQKEQMRQIVTRYHEANKGAHQGREEGGRGGEGFDLSNGGTFNEAAVRAAAQARANARVEMEVTHARMMSEMYNVLTTEQKAQLNAERQKHEQMRQERRAQHEAQQQGQNK